MNQFQYLKCKQHPQTLISSVCTSQTCIYPSRLACMKCCKQHNDLVAFEDFSEFQSTDQVIQALFNKVSSVPLNYLGTNQQDRIAMLDELIAQINVILQNMRSDLIKQFNTQSQYEQLTKTLRQQYDSELQKLQHLFQTVSQIDNYHQSNEWKQMETQLNHYIIQLYKPNSSEIKDTLTRLQSLNQFQDISCNRIINLEIAQLISSTFNRIQLININPSRAMFQSSLLYGKFALELLQRISPKHSCTLIFQGTRDGMRAAQFWNKCRGVSNTLMVCKSRSGAIFGGYSPCTWSYEKKYQQDFELKSFLFSFTRQEIYPLKKRDYALYCKESYGPSYGDEIALCIEGDFQDGYSRLKNEDYSTEDYTVSNNRTHLMGGQEPQLVEMEVFEII